MAKKCNFRDAELLVSGSPVQYKSCEWGSDTAMERQVRAGNIERNPRFANEYRLTRRGQEIVARMVELLNK